MPAHHKCPQALRLIPPSLLCVTGFTNAWWCDLFGVLHRVVAPNDTACQAIAAALLGPGLPLGTLPPDLQRAAQVMMAPPSTQPHIRRNIENLAHLLLALFRVPAERADVDVPAAIIDQAWRNSFRHSSELMTASQLIAQLWRAGQMHKALQATIMLLCRLPLKQPEGMPAADPVADAYLLCLTIRTASKLLFLCSLAQAAAGSPEQRVSLQHACDLLCASGAALGAVVEGHAAQLLPHAALAEQVGEHPATMAGIAAVHVYGATVTTGKSCNAAERMRCPAPAGYRFTC